MDTSIETDRGASALKKSHSVRENTPPAKPKDQTDLAAGQIVHKEHPGDTQTVVNTSKANRPTTKMPIQKIVGSIVAVVAIVALLLGANAVWQTQGAPPDTETHTGSAIPQAGKKQVPVVLTPARQMIFEECVEVSGSIHAEQYALVSARIPGTLDTLFVDEGAPVEAGKTRLFQTDALKLSKAVAIARQDLTVAECSVMEKQALLERNLAGQEQAQNDVNRYRELRRRNAVAAQVLEQQESRCKERDADVKHSHALIELAKAQLEQVRLSLTIAEKDLADSLVVAPITGRISERMREPGEMAGAGTPVLRIENLSRLEVAVFLPEEYYAQVIPGKTKIRVKVGRLDLGDRPVSYKSATVNNKLRTFEVKGLIESPPAGVVPGCLAEATIVIDRRQGIGVPSGAVQVRGNREAVFTVENGTTRVIPVKTGRDTEGWREITEGLAPGTPVVSLGQFLVEDGTPITVVKEDTQ